MVATRKIAQVLICGIFVLAVVTGTGNAADKKDMGGWDLGGAYNQLYKSSERDRLKGTVESFEEVVPMPGMSPGVAIVVKDDDGDRVMVHLGPRWFVDPDGIGVRKGDQVKIKGAWAVIGEEDVFIASKVKRSEFDEYKIRRTRDGYPFWCMSDAELARERAGD